MKTNILGDGRLAAKRRSPPALKLRWTGLAARQRQKPPLRVFCGAIMAAVLALTANAAFAGENLAPSTSAYAESPGPKPEGTGLPLQVIAMTPSGRTESVTAGYSITASFNQPMLPLSSLENMGEFCPVKIEPEIKGRCRWQGTQTVAFEPETPLQVASGYKVMIPAGTKSKASGAALEKDVVWTFETVRPAVIESKPGDADHWIDLNAILFLRFNLEMDPASARDSIALEESGLDNTGEKETIPVGVRRATTEELKSLWRYYADYNDDQGLKISTDTVLAVKPSRSLKPDHSYKLTLKQGLPAKTGTLGLFDERVINFETWYTFRVADTPSKECLPGKFRFSFTNPVRYQDLLDHMTVEPSTPMPQPEGYEAGSTGHREPGHRRVWFSMPDIGYKPDTLYAYKIDGNLKDVFGNKLGQDINFPLETDGYCPHINMAGGFGILESYLPARHPVTAVNAQKAPLIKARITDDGFIPFYNNVWSNNNAVPENAAEKLWDLSLKRNVALRTFINLEDALKPDTGGIVFTRLTLPYAADDHNKYIRALDDVTRLGLTMKSSPDSTLVWASFLKTAAPAKSVPVEIRDNNNAVLWKGKTDGNGFADAPGWKYLGIKDWKRWERPKIWAFAKEKGGTAVMSNYWRGELEPWRFGIDYEWSPRPDYYRGSLFAERGIYRPGETVLLKGILRKLEKGDWIKSDLPALQLKIADSRGVEVLKATVPVSADFSSFDYSYVIPETSPTGTWSVTVTEPVKEDDKLVRPVSEGEEGEYRENEGKETKINLSESFRVEEFKPASFEVKVTPRMDSLLAGDTYGAVIDGWYLFGAPMTDCQAEWTLRLEPGFYEPPGYDGFDFSPGWWLDRNYGGRLLGSGSAKLDAKGKASVEAAVEPGDVAPGPLRIFLEANVSSPDRQRLFGRANTIVHRSNVYLGIRPSTGFMEKGKEWKADVVAVRPGGEKVKDFQIDAKLVRRDWLSARRAGVAGRLEWVTEKRDTVVSSFTFVSSVDTFTWTFTPGNPGQYFFSVSCKDEQGRAAESSVSFYATGKGEAWWALDDKNIVELVADKKNYKPGDTAKILVKSPYAKSRVLVTVEREGILDRWTTVLEGGANVISVPIKENYLPNAYVGVALVQGRAEEPKYAQDSGDDLSKPQARFGYVNLPVDPGGRRLGLRINSDKTNYRPREEVFLTLRTVDEAGQGVAGELTVFAVDEGVLALTGYPTPDVFGAFYGPRPLMIDTADSRLYVIGQRSFGEKGENRGGGGGKGANLEGIDLRSKFIPTAYWNPSVKTDKQGFARVSFKLPDNLSRFRIMAVANTAGLFGSGDAKITVSKPLLLRPSLPRLARTGDEFEGGAVVHNYASENSTVTVALAISGDSLLVTGDPFREIFVESGKAVEVLWNCRAVKPGNSTFKFRAAAGNETDGLEWNVPVKTTEKPENTAATGVTENKAVEELQFPPDALPDTGGVIASLSPTALAGLQEGAKFLLEYPYGCLEQKLSRILPVIVSSELVSAFNLGSLGDLTAETQKVLDRLQDFQHPSGGFGYWPNPWAPDPYITAYALEVTTLAVKEGYNVDKAVIKKAVRWLRTYLSLKQQWAYPYNESEDYAARAYAVYALALHGEQMPSYFTQLYERRDQIPFLAKAYLLKAAPLLMQNDAIKQTLASEMLNQSRTAPASMHFEEPVETRMPWIHNSTVKTTADCLQALIEAQGGFPNSEKVIYWLVGERKAKGRWRTTQENAAALRAFQDFYRNYEKAEPRFTADVSAGQPPLFSLLWSEEFKGRTLDARTKQFSIPELFGSSDTVQMMFAKQGRGRLYYTLRMDYAPAKYEKKAWEGFEIEKEIKPLFGKGEKLSAGSRAIVTLTVRTKQDRTFVVIDDALPAGFEIVDPSFAVEGRENARALAEQSQRGQYWGGFERSEKYDDKILVFADFLTTGEHKYSYLVQATTPGKFAMPATWVEQMYEPEVFGRTASGEVEIQR